MAATGKSERKDSGKAGAVFLILFALPFATVGVVTAVLAVKKLLAPHIVWKDVGFFALFAVVFGGVGFGLIALTIYGIKKHRREEELKARHPGMPWMWREEWNSGMIKCAGKPTVIFAWVFAAFWNLISLPLCFQLPKEILDKENYAAALGFLFPLVGMGLLFWAVKATVKHRKFGSSFFELAAMPGVVGGKVAGVIHTGKNIVPADGFHLEIHNVRRYTTGSGDSRRTQEDILWQDSDVMSRELLESDASRSAIPVSFEIPADASQTDDSESNDQIIWRIEVRADVEGVDYHAVFEVPVFVTDSVTVGSAASESDPAAQYRSKEHREYDAEKIGVSVSECVSGGREFHFAAARHPLPAFVMTLFFLAFGGISVGLAFSDAPILFPIVFGLFTSLLFLGVLEMWLGSSRVVIDSKEIRIKAGLFGGRSWRQFPASEAVRVEATRGMRSGKTVYHDLQLWMSDGKKIALGKHLKDRRGAEWLAGEMRACLPDLERNVEELERLSKTL